MDGDAFADSGGFADEDAGGGVFVKGDVLGVTTDDGEAVDVDVIF